MRPNDQDIWGAAIGLPTGSNGLPKVQAINDKLQALGFDKITAAALKKVMGRKPKAEDGDVFLRVLSAPSDPVEVRVNSKLLATLRVGKWAVVPQAAADVLEASDTITIEKES